MKRILLSLLCALPVLGYGQILLYNDGAMIKVQAGATLFVEGGIQNTATGTIDSDGNIELQGNFVNAGTWEPSQPNTLKFSGNTTSDITPGSAVFQTVVNQKGGGANMNLLGSMTVNTNLDFNSAGSTRITTGNFDLILGTAATSTGYDSDEYVATTGTGMMQKNVSANATYEFPIGDATFYSPLSSNYTGTGYAAANIRAKANNVVHPNKPFDATDFLTRYWDVNQTGISTYSNTLTGTFNAGDDVTGVVGSIKGAIHDGTNWDYYAAANAASQVIGSTTDPIADFTGTNSFGKVNLKVFLAGALPGTGIPPMTTTLNNVPSLIPLTAPYNVAPWNAPSVTAPSVPAGTTDWILVETRDPSINIITQQAAFLKNDGTIVSADGGPLRLKDSPTSAIISIRHRNHLGVRTINALDLVGNPVTSHDFSTGTGQAWTNPTLPPPSINANMRLIGPTYCLWGGNANVSNAIALTKITFIGAANDPQAILNAMGGNSGTPVTGVYSNADVNMNRNISFIGAGNDPAVILQNMAGNSGVPTTQHIQ